MHFLCKVSLDDLIKEKSSAWMKFIILQSALSFSSGECLLSTQDGSFALASWLIARSKVGHQENFFKSSISNGNVIRIRITQGRLCSDDCIQSSITWEISNVTNVWLSKKLFRLTIVQQMVYDLFDDWFKG